MTNPASPRETIGNLSRSELEHLIETIAQKTFQREMRITKQKDSQLLSQTFGAWSDDKTEQEIIQEIYESRNSNIQP